MKKAYRQLLEIASRVTGQAKKFSREIAERIKRGNLSVLHKAKTQLDEMVPRVQQVLRQTRERVLRGNTKADGKLLSIFETHTEVIRKGKAHKPNEFGKLVLIQEAENQIVTHYQVCEQRPADSTLLEACLEQHVQQFGHAPRYLAADPGFFSAANASKAQQMGVSRVSIPSHDTKSAARKQRQKQRWFKELQKWRTGCEGRISVLKRRHGLRRSLYKGPGGIRRWVGFRGDRRQPHSYRYPPGPASAPAVSSPPRSTTSLPTQRQFSFLIPCSTLGFPSENRVQINSEQSEAPYGIVSRKVIDSTLFVAAPRLLLVVDELPGNAESLSTNLPPCCNFCWRMKSR